jgi:predicted small secreted protein
MFRILPSRVAVLTRLVPLALLALSLLVAACNNGSGSTGY